MEENKNNAIEKTEQISQNSSQTSPQKSSKKAKSKAKNYKKSKSGEERQKKAEERLKKIEQRKKARLDKAEKAKKARLDKAEKAKKARLEKIEKAKKAKKARATALKNKREEYKKFKLQQKEERLKRRELLKHESKEERRNRLAKEKHERNEIRREKMADMRAKRQEKAEERKQKRALRSQERRQKRKQNHGVGGWIAAVVSLGCAVLILGALLTFSVFSPMADYMTTDARERQSFYELVGYVDSMDVNLSKLLVSGDDEKQQKIINDIRVESNLATESISRLSLHDEDKFNTTKFINQVGDFAKYLSDKMIDGKDLSGEDIKNLESIYKTNKELKQNLSTLAGKLDENFDFSKIYEGKDSNLVVSEFRNLESNAIEYPQMIYDGAFSDAKSNGKEAKALKNLKEISKKEAETYAKEYFSSYKIQNLELVGEATAKNLSCYDIQMSFEDGSEAFVQISKNGGKVILFNHYKECKKSNYDSNQCKEIATKFLEKAGLYNLKPVWMADGNDVVTFNFASTQDGIICYKDLVKVNVCKERGLVSALDASEYYINHTERSVQKAQIDLSTAKQKVKKDIEIETSRLAIIPKGENQEVLAYEFTGTNNGETYYIYIDANTGREVDIFKVVKTTEGTLLM